MTLRSRTTVGATALALAVGLAACGGGEEAAATTRPSAAATTTTGATETTGPTSTTRAPETTTTTARATTTTPAPGAVLEVAVSSGTVQGPQRPSVSLGDSVVIHVTSDVVDEVHVHGYDLFADVGPAAPAAIEFTADIPGIFEVELEGSRVLLLELEVS